MAHVNGSPLTMVAMGDVRVAVIGAAGRMGATVSEAVERAEGLDLAHPVGSGVDLSQVTSENTVVAVVVTGPDATEQNVHTLIDTGVHEVVGTTGWTEQSLGRVRQRLERHPQVGVLIAPNFALSAVLAMRFAAQAAR